MGEKFEFNLKDSVQQSRSIKERSLQAEISLVGKAGPRFEPVEEEVKQLVKDFFVEQEEWIKEQKNALPRVLEGISEEEIKDAFEKGLMTFFKQEYRLLRQEKGEKDVPEEFSDPAFLKSQMLAYAFDFLLSLRVSERHGETPAQALTIAKLSYRHNPGIVQTLEDQYPDAGSNVIKKAVLSYPSRTKEFLNLYLEQVDKMEMDYPELNSTTIKTLVLKNTEDPKPAIETYLAKVDELEDAFELPAKIIRIAALQHSTDPEGYLHKYQNNLSLYKEKYPELDMRVLKSILVGNTTNPKEAIEAYILRVADFKMKFKDFDEGEIKTFALINPEKPEQFTSDYREKLKDLPNAYSEVPPYIIKRYCLRDPELAENAVHSYLVRLKDLSEKYSEIDQSFREKMAYEYPERTVEFAKEYLAGVLKYSDQYPEVPITIIKKAVYSSPLKPEKNIKKYLAKGEEPKEDEIE